MQEAKTVWVIAVVVCISVGAGLAQLTTGTISGTIKDTSGALLPGTKIVVLNQDTGIPRTVETDSTGHYSASSLGLGNYQVTATRDGFQPQARSGIVLAVSQEAVVDMMLTVGAVNQSVEVSAAAAAVETTTSTVSALVNGEQIRDLPLNGRSVDQLALLTPGVLADRNAQQSPGLGMSTRMSVNGGRVNAMLYLLDGTIVNDQGGGGPGSAGHNMLGVEGVLEFRLLSHNFDAEYGHMSAGVMSQVTRSGTNAFHGSAYEFVRNNIFDARNFFNPGDLPAFRRNQFGGAVGGPIKKDRIFFFANYEGLRQVQGTTINIPVPDLNARNGLLPNPSTGQLQQVPVSPAALPFIKLYPLPNGVSYGDGTAQYLTNFKIPDNENYSLERMDFRLSDKDSFFGRYVYNPSNTLTPRPTPSWGEQITGHDHFVVLGETHIFSAASVSDFRVSFNRTDVFDVPVTLVPIDPSITLVPGQPMGDILPTNGQIAELGSNANRPYFYPQNAFEESETVSILRGKHSLKFGVDIDRVQINENAGIGNERGKVTFSGLATFLAGTPSQFTVTPISENPHFQLGWRRVEFGWFVQDDFRLLPNLTINLGLRQDIFTTPSEVHGFPTIGNLVSLTAPALTPGPPFISDKSTYAPRVGLAWDPFGDGKTSIRVSGGLYYNPIDGREFYSASMGVSSRNFSQKKPPFPYTGGATAAALALTILPNHPDNPTTAQYSLEVQRQLSRSMSLRAGYIGSTSYHLTRAQEVNTEIPTVLANGSLFFPASGPVPNPNFSTINLFSTDARANYNALQVVLQRSLSAGLTFQATYTWSKAMSNADQALPSVATTTASTTMDITDLARDYSLSAYDQRQTLVVNSTYRLPVEKWLNGSVAKAILGGWAINGIYTYGSGLPFDILDGFNNSQNGDSMTPDRPSLNPGFNPNPISGVTAGCAGIPAGQKLASVQRWFNPCAFTLPPAGTFGNLGRNTVIGPGTNNVDFTLVKITPLKEKVRLEFRWELFNLFNHAAFGLPVEGSAVFNPDGTYIGSTGVITNTSTDNREMQLGLKLIF